MTNITPIQLMEVFDRLPVKDREFAMSLAANSLKRKDGPTAAQQEWLNKLYARAMGPLEVPKACATTQIDNMSGILALFNRAGAKLKNPALTFDVEGVGVRLNIAGAQSRFPGSINIASSAFTDTGREWFGRIQRDGSFQPAKQAPRGLGDMLARFSANPLGVASEHGKRTGRCCFCNTSLKNARSVELGYGPICEGRWVGCEETEVE